MPHVCPLDPITCLTKTNKRAFFCRSTDLSTVGLVRIETTMDKIGQLFLGHSERIMIHILGNKQLKDVANIDCVQPL